MTYSQNIRSQGLECHFYVRKKNKTDKENSFSKSNRAFRDLQKIKIFTKDIGQECVLPISTLEAAAEAVVAALGTAQAHSYGIVLPEPFAQERTSQSWRVAVVTQVRLEPRCGDGLSKALRRREVPLQGLNKLIP